MTMTTQAAVERRLLEPASIQRKYRLARRPQAHTVDAEPVHFSFTVSQPMVRRRPRSRFPKWPLKLLLRCAERIGWHVAWPHLEPIIEDIKELVERGWELFRCWVRRSCRLVMNVTRLASPVFVHRTYAS